MIAAWLMVSDTSIGGSGVGVSGYTGIAVVLAIGLLIGLINGLLIVKLRLNAFITTLAVLILLRGATLGTTNGQTLFNLPDPFLYLGSAKWLGVPVSVWIAGILYAVAATVMRYHRFGRAIYAIGGNPEAARVAGIPVDRITIAVYVLGGGPCPSWLAERCRQDEGWPVNRRCIPRIGRHGVTQPSVSLASRHPTLRLFKSASIGLRRRVRSTAVRAESSVF